jgi:antitoxin component of MazEF toxin-antitoxin module
VIKQLQKIGDNKGIIIDRTILDSLNIDDDASFEITRENDGIFLKPLTAKEAYKKIAEAHRKSLDKLAR